MKDTLILYYSLSGNTRFTAEKLQKELDCDIEEIILQKEFKYKGFWAMFFGGMQAVRKSKPEIKLLNKDVKLYKNIIIGTPVWAGTFTPAIRTLLAKYDFSEKNIFLFASFGGSADNTFTNIAEILKNENVKTDGLGLQIPSKNIEASLSEIKKFADKIKNI